MTAVQGTGGVDALIRWLSERDAPAGMDPHTAVKTLALHGREGYQRCVISG